MNTDQPPAQTPRHQAEAAARVDPGQTDGHTAAASSLGPPDPAQAEQDHQEMGPEVLDAGDAAARSTQPTVALDGDFKVTHTTLQFLMDQQHKKMLLMLGVTGAVLAFAAVVFGTMTVSLQSRLNHLDAMLAAMSKRVGELHESLQVVASVNEGFQEMVSKQAGIAASQARLEVRINEMMASTQAMPALAAKQFDEKGQALVKQVQSMESRLQALGGQVQGLRATLSEAGGLKREVEALARLQRERQQAEATSQALANQAKAAAEASRQRDKMVQYPRIGESSPTPGAGVLSTK